MNPHLRSPQIADAVLGTLAPEYSAHLRDCSSCQAEVNRFQEDLSVFGSAVRTWAAEVPPARPVSRGRGFPRLLAAGLVLAAAILAFLVVRPPKQRSSSQDADTALLQQMNTELSRKVPEPLEPLTRLIELDQSESLEQNQ